MDTNTEMSSDRQTRARLARRKHEQADTTWANGLDGGQWVLVAGKWRRLCDGDYCQSRSMEERTRNMMAVAIGKVQSSASQITAGKRVDRYRCGGVADGDRSHRGGHR